MRRASLMLRGDDHALPSLPFTNRLTRCIIQPPVPTSHRRADTPVAVVRVLALLRGFWENIARRMTTRGRDSEK